MLCLYICIKHSSFRSLPVSLPFLWEPLHTRVCSAAHPASAFLYSWRYKMNIWELAKQKLAENKQKAAELDQKLDDENTTTDNYCELAPLPFIDSIFQCPKSKDAMNRTLSLLETAKV